MEKMKILQTSMFRNKVLNIRPTFPNVPMVWISLRYWNPLFNYH